MRLLPVVGRELGAIARRPSAYWVRTASALAAFVALGYVVLVGASRTSSLGRNLFELLSTCAFFYCAIAGIRGTADALSSEKREGTLGLLFLTDLKGYDVVLGKFVSLSITSIYGILAVVPALALSFMSGGVSAQQFFMMCAILLNTLFFSLAVGIFVSTFAQQERPALGAAIGIVFCMFVMPYAVALGHAYDSLEVWETLLPGFLVASPYFAFDIAKDPTLSRILFSEFCQSLAFAHLLGWLCLAVASACVVDRAHLDAPRGKMMTIFLGIRQRLAYGKAELRRAIRQRLLDRNAFAWLAGRDRLKSRYAWIFLGMLGVLWLSARWKAPEMIDEWPVTLAALWFFHWFFKLWMTSEVAARFMEDRRSNALELLLTTPLNEREFARGEFLALLRQFGPPLAVVVVVDLTAGFYASDTGYLVRSGSPMEFFLAGLILLSLDCYVIMWVAMWRSLHTKGANRTIIQTISFVTVAPFLWWFILWEGSWMFTPFTRSGTLTPRAMLWLWTTTTVVYELLLTWFARRSFLLDFRHAATQVFDKPAPFRLRFWRQSAANPIIPNRRSFARALRIAIAGASIIAVTCIGVTLRRNHLAGVAERHLVSLRRAGMPINPAQVGQWRPAAASETGSELIRKAAKQIVDGSRVPVLRSIDAHWDSNEPLAPAARDAISPWVAQNAKFYKALARVSEMRPGGAPSQERNRISGMDNTIFVALQLKARLEMEHDPDAAAETISTLLHVMRILHSEPFGAFGNPRRALDGVHDLLERAANQGDFQAQHWRKWRDILEQFDPIAHFRDNLIFERAHGIPMFFLPVDDLYARFGRQHVAFQWEFNLGWSVRRFVGQDKADFLDYLEEMQRFIDASDKPFATAYSFSQRTWRMPSLASSTFIAQQLTPAFDWLLVGATTQLAHKRILITAAEVEIFRANNRRLPTRLEEIGKTPEIDPFDQKPLRYSVTDSGYIIYAVGEDLKDDGGVRAGAKNRGDVVFRSGPEAAKTRSRR